MGSIFHKDKGFTRRGKSVVLVSVLIIVVLFALFFSTGWFMSSSQKATEDSVHNVSEFYLEELSAQTGRQMQSTLSHQLQGLQAALHVIQERDLEDKGALESHISNMAQIHAFDYYALVDGEGTVHTKAGAFSRQPRLDFLADANIKEPHISIDQASGEENMVIITVPAGELEFQGKPLAYGVLGINASTISGNLSLQNTEDQIFSNVILRDGSYLVKTPHVHLEENSNVYTALKGQADFQEGYSAEEMQENVESGKSGIISYYLKGILHYTYYAPAEGTDWYLTTTIHYGTVSANVEAVRATLTKNSMIQLAVVLFVVFGVLLVYIWQRRRNDILHLEKLKAEEGSRAKSLFLSNMYHDIRTPMNAIIGFTDLAIQHEYDKDASRIHEYLIKIQTASRHLLNLINDVLDMSRIESGKMHLEEVPCNIPEILSGIQAIVQGQVQEREQTLHIDASQVENEDVCCDKLRLNQVLLNLLGNAIKFTPPGGVITVTASQKGSLRNGCGAYEFRVKDNGIGMAHEFAQKVFEPFERERTSTVSGIQGTGLGMAITKNIIDMMKGTIRVETALDIGTEFIINVDFRVHDGNMETEGIQEAEQDELDFTGKRILLAEDNELNREIATEILQQYGFEVDGVGDGAEVVERVQNAMPGDYHLILMDVQMPIMDGHAATKEIRSQKGSPYASIPIIAMTANAFEEDKRAALECGMDGHLAKPVDVPTLLRLLSDVLK